MKAGIYKRRDNGLHVYIAKNRSIRAIERRSRRPDAPNNVMQPVACQSASMSEREQVATWPHWLTTGETVVADRVADVPNGTKDHAYALAEYVARLWMAKHGPKDVRLAFPGIVEGAEYGPGEESDPVADSASRQQRMLSDHPPAVQTEDLGTDLTDSEPATSDFAQRAADQVDTVVAYEHAKKQLQVMLHCEEEALVRWNGDDWEVRWPQELKEMLDNPPKLLPVLPRGWVAERAAQYVGNARANSPIDRGLKDAMRVVLGAEPRFHSGGFTGGLGVPGERPEVLPSHPLVALDFAKLEARVSAMPKWALDVPVGEGAASFAKAAVTYSKETSVEQGRELVSQFRQIHGDALSAFMRQSVASFQAWQEDEFRRVFAKIVGAADTYQDEVLILDDSRFMTLEADVRAGRYAYMGTHIVDTDTGKQYPVSVEKRAIIKHLLDAKPNYVVTSGSANPLPAYVGDRRYQVILSSTLRRFAKRPKLTTYASESDDPAEREAIRRIRAGEIRLIGKQSKRKHKRAGHRVFWCAPMQSWAWEVGA